MDAIRKLQHDTVQQLEEVLKAAKEQCSTLQSLSSQRSDKITFQTEIEELRIETLKVVSECAQLREQNVRLHKQLSDAQRQAEDAQYRILELEQELQLQELQIQEKDDLIARLHEQTANSQFVQEQ